jgi:hypothetical protein
VVSSLFHLYQFGYHSSTLQNVGDGRNLPWTLHSLLTLQDGIHHVIFEIVW